MQDGDLPFLGERRAAEHRTGPLAKPGTAASLARIWSREPHAVVTMHRPDCRSAIIDNPRQPLIAWTAGMTLSRMNPIPASIEDTRAWNVVDRAYMDAPPSTGGGRAPAAPAGLQTILLIGKPGNCAEPPGAAGRGPVRSVVTAPSCRD